MCDQIGEPGHLGCGFDFEVGKPAWEVTPEDATTGHLVRALTDDEAAAFLKAGTVPAWHTWDDGTVTR